jgi:hypothetical protein
VGIGSWFITKEVLQCDDRIVSAESIFVAMLRLMPTVCQNEDLESLEVSCMMSMCLRCKEGACDSHEVTLSAICQPCSTTESTTVV